MFYLLQIFNCHKAIIISIQTQLCLYITICIIIAIFNFFSFFSTSDLWFLAKSSVNTPLSENFSKSILTCSSFVGGVTALYIACPPKIITSAEAIMAKVFIDFSSSFFFYFLIARCSSSILCFSSSFSFSALRLESNCDCKYFSSTFLFHHFTVFPQL